MFSEEQIILSTDNQNNDQNNSDDLGSPNKKKIIFLIIIILGILVLAGIGFFIFKKYTANKNIKVDNNPVTPVATSTQPVLPDFTTPLTSTSTDPSANLSNLVVEYLSFPDFYKAPDNSITPKFIDYKLPLNVKLDVLNYYDLSRKLNLDPALDDLNSEGFSLIVNPYEKENPGFYGVYENLESKQISPLITSDFIIYYYQNILKKVFKDIEESVFYDNLWSINKDLYNAAKNRYESRLAAVGDINDSILEGERLEMAFFAVSLELLKPTPNQIAKKGVIDDESKFLPAEVDKFYFVIPPYLRDDVLREEQLIREGKAKTKSPVLLYAQNYSDFSVPSEYNVNVKLNNFYLTTKWLNSVFPLYYRDKNCPNCLLDKEDWRINFIAANLISSDAANLPDLKNKWARIYKVMSFFKGLREDLSYLQYRDSLVSVFGDDYNITQLFDDKNKSAVANLEKLKTKILTYKMLEIQGGYSKDNPNDFPQIGFKMLADSYWPNSYLFDKLSVPNVNKYLGVKPPKENITSCMISGVIQRCNGVALDAINLAKPVTANNYFSENTNYTNYKNEADKLRNDLNKNLIWQTSNYWSTLSYTGALLNVDSNSQPIFTKSAAWQLKTLETAQGAWVNLQLPLEKFSVNQIFRGVGLNNYSGWSDNSYVEPNLNLVNELLATNSMILKMLTALQIDKEVGPVSQGLSSSSNNLSILRKIIIKEIQGEKLDQNDNDAIADFAKQLKIIPNSSVNKQLMIKSFNKKTSLKSDLNHLKLLVLIHQVDDGKVISVGPVWDYIETQELK
jgi:hypothetical protein